MQTGMAASIGLASVRANWDSLFWYAQKPEDASAPPSSHDHVQDEEYLVIDEEDEIGDLPEATSI